MQGVAGAATQIGSGGIGRADLTSQQRQTRTSGTSSTRGRGTTNISNGGSTTATDTGTGRGGIGVSRGNRDQVSAGPALFGRRVRRGLLVGRLGLV